MSNINQPAMTNLTGVNGERIGSRYAPQQSGVEYLYDAHMKTVGRYDSHSNSTYDANGRFVGKGNLTAMLLK